MSRDFADILSGLMNNRRLSPEAVSWASGRATTTITKLLSGSIAPTAEILADIGPVLQMPVADLMVVAGLTSGPIRTRPAPYRATAEIGDLVAAASHLTPEQVAGLVEIADRLKAESAG